MLLAKFEFDGTECRKLAVCLKISSVLSFIHHSLRKIFNMGGGLKQLRAKRTDRALARDVHGSPGGWPPDGGCTGAAAPCLRKFCIL